MHFGSLSPAEAVGGILAHQVRAGDLVLRKGHVLTLDDCAQFEAAGIASVLVARLEAGDIGEDAAAAELARAAAGAGVRVDPPFTGRANLFAGGPGLLIVDRDRVEGFNRLDDALTLATLPPFRVVAAGEMVGTVKIIPFALPQMSVDAGAALLNGALRVAPFRPLRVAVLSTRLPNLKDSAIDKTLMVSAARLAAFGGTIAFEARLAHEETALADAIRALDPAKFDLVLIFGAAAISDRRDIIPAAIEAAGGQIEHLGMPVDPGNLLLLARWGGIPVLGAPGCARSKRENGFDWVLERLAANIPVTRADIQAMGVGGLLMEIVSRPQPRAGHGAAILPAPLQDTEQNEGAERVGAILLAAGRSLRFGAGNKLLAPFEGQAMAAHALALARSVGLAAIVVVTGHDEAAIRAALCGDDLTFAHNPDFAAGMSSSLRAGLSALPAEITAAFILLGDMPQVKSATLRRLLQALADDRDAQAFIPTFAGRWGNPVLVRRGLFASLMRLHGDQGARKLLEAARDSVCEVAVDDPGILADFDTVDSLEHAVF